MSVENTKTGENSVASENLSVLDVAHLLDIRPGDVRSLIKDQKILAIRTSQKTTVIPRRQFGLGQPTVNKNLRGTLIVLSDSGMPADEQWQWLMEVDPTLGKTPLEALEAGAVHVVRRLALTAAAI